MNFVSDYCRVYDVVFMDIEMPFLDGMHAARKLRELDPSVMLVFVTRLASYALAGYEVDAAGYIVKPVEYPSLSRRLDKAVRAMQTRAQGGRRRRIFRQDLGRYCQVHARPSHVR